MKTLILRKSAGLLLALSLPLALGQGVAFGQTETPDGKWEVWEFTREGADYSSEIGNQHFNRSWSSYWSRYDQTYYGMYGTMFANAGSKTTHAYYNSPYVRSGAFCHQIGGVQAFLGWVPHPQNPNELPPKVFWVKETAWAGAMAETASASKLIANNGLGTLAVTTTDSAPIDGLPIKKVRASGDLVTKIKNPDRKTVMPLKLRKLHAEAAVQHSSTEPKRVYVETNLGYQVKEVHYSIGSPDIEISYYKAQRTNPLTGELEFYPQSHDFSLSGAPDEWPHRNELDRKKLDTVVSYAHPQYNTNPPQDTSDLHKGYYGGGSFYVSQDAFSNPQFKWTVSGAGEIKGALGDQLASDTYTYPSSASGLDFNASMSYWGAAWLAAHSFPSGKLYLGNNPFAFPQTTNIKVVTSEGSVGHVTGEFEVTWHAPREKTSQIESIPCRFALDKLVSGLSSDGPSGVNFPVQVNSKEIDFGTIAEGIGTVIGTIKPETKKLTGALATTGIIQALSGIPGPWTAPSDTISETSWRHDASTWTGFQNATNNAATDDVAKEQLNGRLQGISEMDLEFYRTHTNALGESDGYTYFSMEIWRVIYVNCYFWLVDIYGKNGYFGPSFDYYWQPDPSRTRDRDEGKHGIQLETVYRRNSTQLPQGDIPPSGNQSQGV